MRTFPCLLSFTLLLLACGGDDVPLDGGIDALADSSGGNDTGTNDTGVDGDIPDSGMDSGSDGSSAVDGSKTDSGVTCGSKMGGGFQGMGQCGASENYKCGNDKYEIDCQCPAATCACRIGNQTVKTLMAVSGCPQCSFSFSSLAAQCGFPY